MAIITKLKSSSSDVAVKMKNEDPFVADPPRKPIILKFKFSSSSAVAQDLSAAHPKRIILKLKRKIATEDQDSNPAKRKKEDPSPSTAADLSLISLNYISQGLKMSKEEIDRLKTIELKNLLGKKKLFLVLDLDHTLLHTVSKKRLTPIEKQLLKQQDVSDSVMFRYKKKVTKLRPFVRPFLEEASRLFELCVYTMGGHDYAQKMVSFLDPDKKYFGSRIISCEDNTRFERKGLDVVMAPENVVLIVDDTESVWDKHTANLIQIEKYNFFVAASSKGTASRTYASSFTESLESETDHELVLVFNILQRAHRMFFEDNMSEGRDVRNVMKSVWENLGRR